MRRSRSPSPRGGNRSKSVEAAPPIIRIERTPSDESVFSPSPSSPVASPLSPSESLSRSPLSRSPRSPTSPTNDTERVYSNRGKHRVIFMEDHKDHLEVCLPNSRLLSGLIGMWSSMKITLLLNRLCNKQNKFHKNGISSPSVKKLKLMNHLPKVKMWRLTSDSMTQRFLCPCQSFLLNWIFRFFMKLFSFWYLYIHYQ